MEPSLIDVGRRLAAAQDRQLARDRVETTPSRLLADLSARRRAARRVAAAISIAAAIVLGAAVIVLRPRSLAFTVGARSGQPGAWIAADAREPMPLRFSDGSRVVLAPSGRARVPEIGAAGALVVLERGAVDAEIVHRDRARWQIDAGPFTVHVTGTRFRLAWEPDTEQLDLVLSEGSVRVTGPMLDGGRAVVAGETLRVRVQEGRLELAARAPVATTSAAPAAPGSAAPEAPGSAALAAPGSTAIEAPGLSAIDAPGSAAPEARGSAAPEAPSSAAPSAATPSALAPEPRVAPPPSGRALRAPSPHDVAEPVSWRELALVGRYREALDRAKADGFDALCGTESAADLLALGDAARFAGDAARARQAYLALRQRHPGGRDAATAAFVLGRMAFDQQAAFGDAARWFGAYLAEAPGGSYAREAAGRLIEAHQRAGDDAAARAAARRYLETHPKGPHAELARSVLVR